MRRLGMIALALLIAGAFAFASGDAEQQGGAAPSAPVGTDEAIQEAPQLRELVDAGELPPLDERLPAEPRIVEPVGEIGRYGGDLNLGMRPGRDHAWIKRTIAYENLVEWNRDWSGIIPNVAKDYEVSEDGTTFTFYLRDGVRWSDGELFTADDIVFWYEAFEMNQEINPAGPASWWMTNAGEAGVVRKIDDYTVEFSFSEPHGLFLVGLAEVKGVNPTNYPEHYLSQFHKEYNSDVDELVEQEGFDNWVDLFLAKGANLNNGGQPTFMNPDRPSLYPWILQDVPGETSRTVAVRNPYYFKTDPEGRQLPYIDRVVYDHVDSEVLLLKILNGEIDYADRYVATLDNKATLADGQSSGGYHFVDVIETTMNTVLIQLNLTHEDPVMRQIFQNRDFRIGLSHAINRDEIIDAVFVGQGEPWQAAPRPESRFYDEEYAKQYTEYDPDLANEYLDSAGYTERDSEGFRLGPDGERISFAIEIAGIEGIDEFGPVMELVQQYWAEVGVEMLIRQMEDSLWGTRKGANKHDAVVDPGHAGLGEIIIQPRHYLPFNAQTDWGTAWVAWWRNPDAVGLEFEPQEPPEAAKRQFELYEEIAVTPDPARQDALMRELLEIGKEQFWVMGISLPAPSYAVVKDNLRNVMDGFPKSYTYPTPAPIDLEQWYFDR